MQGIIAFLYSMATRFHGAGLFGICLLDSSFLFIPLGTDLLLVAMVAQNHEMAPFYALLAALGSVSGCAIIDTLSRKEGEKGLERFLSRRRIRSITRRVKKGAAWALFAASIMPPPFPFTAAVITASALQYSRKKLLIVVGVSRFGRFLGEGLLAIYFGRQLLNLAHSNTVKIGVIVLITVSFGGSAISAYQWIRKHKKRQSQS